MDEFLNENGWIEIKTGYYSHKSWGDEIEYGSPHWYRSYYSKEKAIELTKNIIKEENDRLNLDSKEWFNSFDDSFLQAKLREKYSISRKESLSDEMINFINEKEKALPCDERFDFNIDNYPYYFELYFNVRKIKRTQQ